MNIIQIGCHDGNDHVLTFVQQNIDQIKNLILIDANYNVIPYCQKTYEFLKNTRINYEILNYAVVPYTQPVVPFLKLHIPENHLCSLHCSYSYAHMKEHHHQTLMTVKVPTITIHDLIIKYQFSTIDYIFIDTEGMDVSIIDTLPFNQVFIQNIKFEHAHTDSPFSNGGEKYELTVQKLKDLGYLINRETHDTIAHKNT